MLKAIRDDPALSEGALLLFDARARTEGLSDDEVRFRVGTVVEILRPSIGPALAVVLSSIIAPTAQVVQREASIAGLRIGLFDHIDAARRWLTAYAPGLDQS